MANTNKWFCQICGSSYMDSDEKKQDLSMHLKDQHDLSLNDYNKYVQDSKIGSSHLKVKLLSYPNTIDLPIVSFLSQTWGPTFDLEDYSNEEIQEMKNIALEGKSLSTVLECIQFTFQIDGLSRAASHQLVRVRIGSGFSQKGMSDAYYGDAEYVTPAAIVAAGKKDKYDKLIHESIELYNELFEAGVTYQDARYILPHAMTTSLVWTVNYLALKNFCGKRMMRSQSWEMNMLCQLIKEEINNVYPELAKGLVPICDYSKKCQSFGNLFDGCGKYHLERKHNRYVFSGEQILHNLKFNKEYLNRCEQHNKGVLPKNNHFRLLANERINQDLFEGYGKYADQIFDVLMQYRSSGCKDARTLFCNEILPAFESLYGNFRKYENNESEFVEDINAIKTFNYNVLTISVVLLDTKDTIVLKEIWNLHAQKNKEYNDGWYYDGVRGVLKDLHRKIHRLNGLLEEKNVDYWSLKNTLYDTILYGVFLEVSYKEDIPLTVS